MRRVLQTCKCSIRHLSVSSRMIERGGFRTVATFQTLLRSQRLEKFRAEYMKALIVDEAHHAAAPS